MTALPENQIATMSGAIAFLKRSLDSPEPELVRAVTELHILEALPPLPEGGHAGLVHNLEIGDWPKLSGQLAAFASGRDRQLRRMLVDASHLQEDLRSYGQLTELLELTSEAAGKLRSQAT